MFWLAIERLQEKPYSYYFTPRTTKASVIYTNVPFWPKSLDTLGGAWYLPHDLVIYGCNNRLSAPLQVVAGNPLHAESVCQGSNTFGGCDGNIEEEMEDILVELPASNPTDVVPSHLISSIYTAYVLVVANDGCGACYCYPTTILLPS